MFAVTTCLPADSARRMYSRAGSVPPITSTIRSLLLEDLVEVALAARQHAGDLGPQPGGGLDRVRPPFEQLVERPADRPAAEEPDPKARHAP